MRKAYPTHSSENTSNILTPTQIQTKVRELLEKKDLFEALLDDSTFEPRRSLTPPKAAVMDVELQSKETEGNQLHQGCKCSKIDCLKLYCECFAKGKICNEHCSCVCCKNTQHNHQQIYKAKQVANWRHPGFFRGIPAHVPSRKCTCKKSLCQKKYCQCYNAGLKCSEECECINCHNEKPIEDSSVSQRMEIQIQA